MDDLLDQVMILAYERFKDRPRKVSLDLWLTDLVQDALEQWIKQEPRPHVSLQERAEKFLPAEAPQEDEEEWWSELMGEEETLTAGRLDPGPGGDGTLEESGGGGASDRLLASIAKLPPKRRQAFLLHALEGYATDEIAMLQDRPESEVKADIEAARKWLRDQLQAEGLVTARTKAGRPHRAAKSRRSRPGEGSRSRIEEGGTAMADRRGANRCWTKGASGEARRIAAVHGGPG